MYTARSRVSLQGLGKTDVIYAFKIHLFLHFILYTAIEMIF